MRKSLIVALAAAGLLVLALALNTARNYAGWQPVTDTPDERLALLAPHWRLLRPETPGPHPVAVLLSGCDGVRDNMDYWARQFTAMGRAALILDSHGPRGLNKAQAWRAVCAAQLLPASERAGDLAVALWALHDMPGINAQDVALLGASHGGWTIMEFLRELDDSAPPPGLTQWPAPARDLARQLGPVVLLYPYCGLISNATKGTWPARIKSLMLLAEQDSITDPEDCRKMARTLTAEGVDINVTTYAGINHGFDQRDRSSLSPLEFEPQARARATRDIAAFMRGFAERAAGL